MRKKLRYCVPYLVLLVGLASTAAVTAQFWTSARTKDRVSFEHRANEMSEKLSAEMDKYVTLLRATASLLTAADGVQLSEFRNFIRRLEPGKRYPGIQGLGLTQVIPKEKVPKIEEEMRRQGYDGFEIWPKDDRETYHAILFLEPLDQRNRAALGYDMFTEPTRRAAMQRACDTAEPSITSKVTLVQEIDPKRQAGFLIYMPLYQGGEVPAAVEARRAALVGYAYSPFRAGDLFKSIFPDMAGLALDFAVFDGDTSAPESLFFDSAATSGARGGNALQARVPVRVLDQVWTLRFMPSTNFDYSADRIYGDCALLAGLVISGFLFLFSLGLVRALNLAEQRTADLRLSQTALAESQELLAVALASSNTGTFRWDMEEGRMFWDSSMSALVGRSQQELSPDYAAFLEMVHPADRVRVDRAIWNAAETGQHLEEEMRVVWPDSSIHWLLGRAAIFLGEDGQPKYMSGACTDVTRLKEAEEQLKRFNELLEQRVRERTAEAELRAAQVHAMALELTQAEHRERRRLASLLHDELQQLLAAAKIRLSSAGWGSPSDMAEGVQQAEEMLGQAIQVTRSLSVELSPPVLRDRGLIAALEWVVRRILQEYRLRVHFSTSVPELRPENESIGVFLLQAVRELLFNVFKHAGVEEAWMRAEVNEDTVNIVIKDRGAGFAPALVLDLDNPTEHFGLVNVKRRVELLGGTFSISSRPGEGTRVVLGTPRAAFHVPEPQDPALATRGDSRPHQTPAPADGKIRVLLVDDHKIVREGIARLLRNENDLNVVGEAANGLMAVQLATEIQPDVIIMDINMPLMNGIEATRAIREQGIHSRIIALSMHERDDMSSAMLMAGANAFLSKDGPSADLLVAIRDMVPA